MTRSTSPQSMPRSRLAVATSPRSLSRGHRRLDLAPRLDRQAAVVDSDRQPLIVLVPQLLEDQLGEAARVGEDERRLVLLDEPHDVGDRVISRVAAPRDLVLGNQDREVGLGAGIAEDEIDELHVGIGREPGAIGVGVADRRRQPDAAQARRELLQPRHRQRQEVAALLLGEAVELVDDDRPQIREHRRGIGIAQQQAQRFRRGQQHLRRLHPLARLAVRRRVAGAGLDPDRKPHLLDRADEVALDVDRERLQRRDVERVQPFARLLRELADGRQEARQRLARAGRGDQQRAPPSPRQLQHFELVPPRAPALGFEPAVNDWRKLGQRSSVPSRRRLSSSR